MKSLLLIILFSMIFAFSCTPEGDADNNTNNTSRELLLTELGDNIKSVTCHHFVDCADQTTPYITSEEDCQDVFGVLSDLLMLNEIKDVVYQDAEINMENYDSCLAILPNMQCGEYYDNFAACRQILNAGFAEGEYCDSHFECDSGYCNSEETCPNPGTCQPRALTGESCSSNPGCDYGLVCNRFTLLCGDSQAQGTGDVCHEHEDCLFGNSCVTPDGAESGNCQKWLTAGLNCDSNDSSIAQCEPGTGCDEFQEQCVAVGIVGPDAACDETHVCNVGERYFCIPIINKCTYMPVDGETCMSFGLEKFCWMGNYCGVDDFCVEQKSIGTSCDNDEECLSLYCGVQMKCEYNPCKDPLATVSF
jgi:hypothetical protein